MARILVAEDEPGVREFVDRALTSAGHHVVGVADGIAALEQLQGGRFDLLITDIVMPGMDGIELALKVTKDYPGLAILLMTGYAAERQRAHNLEELAHRVIAKPFTLRQIRDAATETLAAGQDGA